MARLAATVLGAFAGRNWLLELLTSLPRLGSAREHTSAAASQASRITQRNRTVALPSEAKIRSVTGGGGARQPSSAAAVALGTSTRPGDSSDGGAVQLRRSSTWGMSQEPTKASAAIGTATTNTSSIEPA